MSGMYVLIHNIMRLVPFLIALPSQPILTIVWYPFIWAWVDPRALLVRKIYPSSAGDYTPATVIVDKCTNLSATVSVLKEYCFFFFFLKKSNLLFIFESLEVVIEWWGCSAFKLILIFISQAPWRLWLGKRVWCLNQDRSATLE